MILKTRYIVTKASNDGTFTVGDQVWLLEDGAIMCKIAARPKALVSHGWIDPHEVPAATEGWEIEVDKNWLNARLTKLCAEIAELEGVANVQD